MAHLILGEHPDGLTVRLVHGDGMTLAATLTDAAGAEIDWPATPSLEFAGPDHDVITTHVATIDGPTASWQLTRAQVDAIWTGSLTRYGNATTYVRALLPDGDDGSVEYAGRVAWSDGWTAGTQVQVKTFTRPVPVSTPGGGSDSLTVVNGGTVTLDDTKAEGSLVGYRVKSSTEFTANAGDATLEPGAYTFERTDTGWDYYPIAAGTSLVSAPPAPGWVTIATDAFTAADGSALVGRATTTGGLSWVSQSNGADVLIQNNKAVFATGGYGRSLRLPLSADHTNGLRVTLDYELVGGVGGVSIGAGVSFTPHTSGITLDGGNLYPGGSVAATALTGTTTGIATTGTMQVEFTPARGIVVRINGTQIATAQLGEDLKGQVVQINWEAATTAIDNLVIEAVA